MNWKELTKTFMMVSTWKKLFGFQDFFLNQRCKGWALFEKSWSFCGESYAHTRMSGCLSLFFSVNILCILSVCFIFVWICVYIVKRLKTNATHAIIFTALKLPSRWIEPPTVQSAIHTPGYICFSRVCHNMQLSMFSALQISAMLLFFLQNTCDLIGGKVSIGNILTNRYLNSA